MTTLPKTRDLARRLLAYEAASVMTSEPSESATIRVYEKLRQGLGEFAGAAGFQSFASRALSLAKTEAPSLSLVRSLQMAHYRALDRAGARFNIKSTLTKIWLASPGAGEAGIILIARLLGLLHLFLGERLTLSLLRVKWPGAALDDWNSENGRKA